MTTVYKNLGAYNWADRSQKQWQLVVRLDDGSSISELFPEDEEPEIDGLPPSEVVELISVRNESYFFRSSREEQRAKIAFVRENAEAIDTSWAAKRIACLRKNIESMQREVDALESAYGKLSSPQPSFNEE